MKSSTKLRLKLFILMVSFGLFMSIAFMSCTYNDELVDLLESQQEFVFDLQDLEGYQNWTVIGTKERLDIGHFRTIYINKPEEAGRTSGAYSLGTIIVKESRDFNDRSKVVRYQVMAKRGGGFNQAGNGWEWGLAFDDDLALLERNDNTQTLNGSTCYSCHAGYNDLVIKTY